MLIKGAEPWAEEGPGGRWLLVMFLGGVLWFFSFFFCFLNMVFDGFN